MQQHNVPQAIQSGVPSQAHWRLPSGFGSVDAPPEQGGLPAHVGQVRYDVSPLRPGLGVYSFATTLRSPVTFVEETLTEQPYLWLDVTSCGKGEYRHGASVRGNFSGDQFFCAMLRDPVTEITFAPGVHKGANVAITPDRLREMLYNQRLCRPLDDFLDGRFDPLITAYRPTESLRNIARQIASNPYQGIMASVFLEAKAFEMLAECLRALMNDTPPEGAGRSHRYASAARDLIIADLVNPPRIEDVAKQVGLSQRRLNEIFREVFQASPFQCLINWRLEHARELLAADELTVKQVAYLVGYAHTSNFSQAFARRFGHPPTGRPEA